MSCADTKVLAMPLRAGRSVICEASWWGFRNDACLRARVTFGAIAEQPFPAAVFETQYTKIKGVD